MSTSHPCVLSPVNIAAHAREHTSCWLVKRRIAHRLIRPVFFQIRFPSCGCRLYHLNHFALPYFFTVHPRPLAAQMRDLRLIAVAYLRAAFPNGGWPFAFGTSRQKWFCLSCVLTSLFILLYSVVKVQRGDMCSVSQVSKASLPTLHKLSRRNSRKGAACKRSARLLIFQRLTYRGKQV